MSDNTQTLLEIKGLKAEVIDHTTEEKKEILKGVDLTVNKGELHVLMGTNGCGKSTLANTLMGHPNYTVTGGSVTFCGEDVLSKKTNERAKLGMFLAQQYPTAIPGLAVGTFLKTMLEAIRGEQIPVRTFRKELEAAMERLKIDRKFLKRSLNDGFSGGEKKRNEILQMNLVNPLLSILDETDSGLDVDALKLVFQNVDQSSNSENAFLIITHYNRVLQYFNATHVHIMKEGKIVKSGGTELSDIIENEGFEKALEI